MTRDEYTHARGELMALLEKQPNLFQNITGNEQGGRHLAQGYWSFIETLVALMKKQGPKSGG